MNAQHALVPTTLRQSLLFLFPTHPCPPPPQKTTPRSGREIMEAILSSPSPVKAGPFLKLRPKEIAALTDALIAAMDASERPKGRGRAAARAH